MWVGGGVFLKICTRTPVDSFPHINSHHYHPLDLMNDAKAAAAKAEYIRRKYLATAPGDASTKEYIANRYLSGGGDGGKKKKKVTKRIHKGNIGIVDEEEDSWRRAKVEEDDSSMPVDEPTVAETKSLYTKSSGWTTIHEGENSQSMQEDEEDDEKPMIVGEGNESPSYGFVLLPLVFAILIYSHLYSPIYRPSSSTRYHIILYSIITSTTITKPFSSINTAFKKSVHQ